MVINLNEREKRLVLSNGQAQASKLEMIEGSLDWPCRIEKKVERDKIDK